MRSVHLLTIILLVGFLFSSCATQKSREKRSALNRFYHNTTAYYNGYFNANVLYEQSKLKLSAANQDNYIQVLDVYDYVEVPNPEVIAADVDRAIEKLSVVVALHRQSAWTDDSYLLVGKSQYLKHDYETAEETLEYMKEVYSPEAVANRKKNISKKAKAKAKNKEREEKKKIADKAREEKKEAAEEAREERQKDQKTTAKERKKEAERKQKERRKEAKARAKARKKGQKLPPKTPTTNLPATPTDSVGNQPPLNPIPPPEVKDTAQQDQNIPEAPKEETPKKENYFLKHRPAYAAGLLWLGRVYTERQLYEDGMRAFNEASMQLSASDEVLREIPVAQAHSLIKQERYSDAIPYLNLAIQRANKKKLKARYYYILGQIQQRQGQLADAVSSFRSVRKLRPGYEMDFNARMNLTLSEWMAGQASAEQAQKNLEKMLKDKKNQEYKDRIYFALADINLYNKDTTLAIANLRESLGTSSSNKAQRAETQLKLADLYYAREQYIEAKTYYEQSLENLAVTDDRYTRASLLSRNLTDIARNLQTITLQDSLIRIAGMTEKERIELAEAIKADRLAKVAEQQKKADANTKEGPQAQSVNLAQSGQRNAPAGTAKSTFFAYDTKTLERGIKDFKKYWGDRPLSDGWRQSSKSISLNVEEATSAEEAVETKLTKSELQEMFKDVPFEEEALVKAHEKIEDAMMALGRLYRERLEYNEKSIEVLNELLKRYPETESELDAWYFLYLAHNDLGQRAEAKRYFDLITGKYPESTYARVLSDPEYLGESRDKERRLNAYYSATYDYFQDGQYQTVWDRLGQVDTLFGKENRLQTKFAMLGAMTTGNLEGKDAYIDALKEVIAKFPNTEEEKRAKEILRLLGDKSVSPKDLTGQESQESGFELDPDGVHYIIINWNINQVNLEDAQQAVNEFNKTYFKADRLRLSANIFLNVDVPLMVIRKFDSAAKAMEFFNLSQKYPEQFIGKPGVPFKVYPATQQNYRIILKERSLDSYDTFFKENYK
ncbi:MAG: tetratricopeptide repeat protein [Saprospiraceae bacterium]|nr:tetratricopeptide repeat protein [Saprospiraceae bacterium]